MVLGTAQFGMDYGIANISGKPSKKEVFAILDLAWEKGIRCFDTAPGYGSEALLGEFITGNDLQDEAKLMTKIPSLEKSSNYRKSILLSLETSLNHLGSPIDVLFFHDPGDFELLLKDWKYFEKLLYDYPISTLGVSVYEPEEIEKLSGCVFKLAFQFPYNVLDRRFENIRMLEGKRCARSVFLQGLLASSNDLRPDTPKELSDLQKEYHIILADFHLDPVRFAVSFVATHDTVDYFLIGVDSAKQLHDILALELYKKKKMNIMDTIQKITTEKLLDPRKWN